jgi:membrane protease YdiL (CAAX protease family)
MADDPTTPNADSPESTPPQNQPEPHGEILPSFESAPNDFRPSMDLRGADQLLWSGWDVLALTVLTLVSMFVLTVIGMGIAMYMQPFRGMKITDLAREPRLVIPVQVAAYLIVFGCMMLIVRRRRAASFWHAIQWNWPGASAVAYFLGGVGLALTIQFLSALLPIPKQLPIEKYFKDASGTYLMVIFGITVAPLMEELFFRGFLYPVLARRAGVNAGIVVTAFLFALIHQSQLGRAWAPVFLLFVVGLVLTYVRARTGSVASSFLLHVAYNSALFLLLWIQTDHFRHMERAAAAVFNLKP